MPSKVRVLVLFDTPRSIILIASMCGSVSNKVRAEADEPAGSCLDLIQPVQIRRAANGEEYDM